MGDRGYHRDSYDRRGTRRSYDRHSDRDRQSRSDHYAPEWSWASTIVSIISMTIFASWFGIIGLLFSGLSYTDHKVGDYKRARHKRMWAWCCSVTGILLTIVAVSLLLVVMFAISIPAPDHLKYYEYFFPPWLRDHLNRTGI